MSLKKILLVEADVAALVEILGDHISDVESGALSGFPEGRDQRLNDLQEIRLVLESAPDADRADEYE